MIDTDALTQACVVYGPAVGLGVAMLKRLGFVGRLIARNPKLVAGALSVASVALTSGLGALTSGSLAGYAACVAAIFAGAVTTHEVALDPLAKSLNLLDVKKG